MPEELSFPEKVAIARLHALLEILPTAFDQKLTSVGITSFEFTLLQALAAAPGHYLQLSVLSTKTNATLPRLSRVVTSLERKGLVERQTCPHDRRANNAVLTDAGLERFHASAPIYAAAARELVFDGLSSPSQLAEICLEILRTIDPERKLDVTHPCAADPQPCTADPPPCPADPES